jgi:hypothetical protein
MCNKLVVLFLLHVELQKSQQLAQLGIPPSERILLPFILELTKALLEGVSWRRSGSEVSSSAQPSDHPDYQNAERDLQFCLSLTVQICMRLLRSLFANLALGKFLDVQAAFGASGVHAKVVDISLDLLRGPSASSSQVMHVSLT